MPNFSTLRRVAGGLLCAALFSAPLWAEDEYQPVTFTLANQSGVAMTHFYMSPPDTQAWEDDVLGVDVLESGDSVSITVQDGRPDCHYDIKAVFADDTEAVTSGTVCDGETYTATSH